MCRTCLDDNEIVTNDPRYISIRRLLENAIGLTHEVDRHQVVDEVDSLISDLLLEKKDLQILYNLLQEDEKDIKYITLLSHRVGFDIKELQPDQ